jgi:hypothetical protein
VQIGFALHQMKRGKEFRSIIARAARLHAHGVRRGRAGIPVDGDLSGDPAMLQLCQPGEDAHGYMAARIVGADYRELWRGEG